MPHNHDHHGHSHDKPEHRHDNHNNRASNSMFSCSKSLRLTTMLLMIFVYFFVEIIIGHATHSLTLIADSFHMLSDFIALVIALLSVWVFDFVFLFN